jgi:uncharacterized protein YqeY
MLKLEIQSRIRTAMKARKTVEREILGVALGEIQTVEARKGELTEEETASIVKKLVKSNRETIEAGPTPEQKAILEEEILVLESLLPKAMGADDIVAALGSVADAVRAASNDGQATGIAMKALKAQGAPVDGKTVAEAVKRMRAG